MKMVGSHIFARCKHRLIVNDLELIKHPIYMIFYDLHFLTGRFVMDLMILGVPGGELLGTFWFETCECLISEHGL